MIGYTMVNVNNDRAQYGYLDLCFATQVGLRSEGNWLDITCAVVPGIANADIVVTSNPFNF